MTDRFYDKIENEQIDNPVRIRLESALTQMLARGELRASDASVNFGLAIEYRIDYSTVDKLRHLLFEAGVDMVYVDDLT